MNGAHGSCRKERNIDQRRGAGVDMYLWENVGSKKSRNPADF